jgi:hypothetical protein
VLNSETFADDSVYDDITLKTLVPLSKVMGDFATLICISNIGCTY